MIESLLNREIQKRPDRVRIDGRVLFLVDDAKLIRKQLEGEDLPYPPGAALRDDISTDEITPAYICYHYDEKLGNFPYLGLRAGGEFPLEAGLVRKGGFAVSVSGKRRGKGSSREQSPYAERAAGIQLVIAENIERIYRQNCQNLGILTSTDFGLIERIRAGEEIPLEEFTKGQDQVTREIIEYGGLFNYNVARMQGKVSVPPVKTSSRPMNLAEKILACHFVTDLAENKLGVDAVKPGDAGFVRTDLRFSHEYVTPMAAMLFEDEVGKEESVVDRSSIVFFRDHLTFLSDTMPEERKKQGLLDLAVQLKDKQQEFSEQQRVRLHGETAEGGSEAICHSKMIQTYALPGQVIIGTDSHTPHSGALGCVAFGVGTTAIFNSWITKDVQMRVPESVRVWVRGQRPEGVTAKDFMLAILRTEYVRSGAAIGKIVEYAGDAVEALGIDERATMTNMAAEVGAYTGIIAPDGKTAKFLVEQRGMDPAKAERLCIGMASDADAVFAHEFVIDASSLEPMVATPGDPGNGIFLSELPEPVRINIAYGGSCTAGKAEDMDMYALVLKEAMAAGKKVHADVKFYIQAGSKEVKRYCEAKGYLELFRESGVEFIEPSCGACINAGPGVSDNRDQITVSAINRNFPGRSGPGQMYLASPLTVAASAIRGVIAPYDPS